MKHNGVKLTLLSRKNVRSQSTNMGLRKYSAKLVAIIGAIFRAIFLLHPNERLLTVELH